nr:reverse transcriptase domain-containing protein [Tanacetum cinerariifolium]
MMAIFHDMIEKTMEVFMDDFSVFWISFQTCLSHLEKKLKRCEDTNLCLNWEKSHFMVKEVIVLGHKISKNRIEVDKAKVDVIAKLPYLTTVKGIRSFLGHADFYRRFRQYFSKIARPMTRLLEKDTPFIPRRDCSVGFYSSKDQLWELQPLKGGGPALFSLVEGHFNLVEVLDPFVAEGAPLLVIGAKDQLWELQPLKGGGPALFSLVEGHFNLVEVLDPFVAEGAPLLVIGA